MKQALFFCMALSCSLIFTMENENPLLKTLFTENQLGTVHVNTSILPDKIPLIDEDYWSSPATLTTPDDFHNSANKFARIQVASYKSLALSQFTSLSARGKDE